MGLPMQTAEAPVGARALAATSVPLAKSCHNSAGTSTIWPPSGMEAPVPPLHGSVQHASTQPLLPAPTLIPPAPGMHWNWVPPNR